MSSDTLWPSEAALYGMMFLNIVAVGIWLAVARRRGHMRDMDDAGEALRRAERAGEEHDGR